LRRLWGSSKWPVVQARVDSSWLEGSWVWNCPTAEVAYTYEFAGQTNSAIDSNPFFLTETAKRQVERFRRGEAAIVMKHASRELSANHGFQLGLM
jgi:hypothetical protein